MLVGLSSRRGKVVFFSAGQLVVVGDGRQNVVFALDRLSLSIRRVFSCCASGGRAEVCQRRSLAERFESRRAHLVRRRGGCGARYGSACSDGGGPSRGRSTRYFALLCARNSFLGARDCVRAQTRRNKAKRRAVRCASLRGWRRRRRRR